MAELIELTCPNCGGKLEWVAGADQLVCPHCGTELVVAAEEEAITLSPVAEPLKCPKCGKVDRVQKASGIYSSGVSSGRFSGSTWAWDSDGSFVTLSGHTQTELSRLLSPPKKPSSLDLAGVLLVLLGLAWCSLFEFVGALSVLLAGLGCILMLAGLLGVPLIPLGLMRIQSRSKGFPIEKERWETAMRRWESLYYCARDDGVFVPGEMSLIPIGQVQTYLYAS